MKKILYLMLTFAMLAFLLVASPTTVYAQSEDDSTGHIVFGSNYTLDSGEKLIGDLLVFGGNATLMEGSIIEGDVMIAGGTLNASGTINGDIITFGGVINLNDTAVIDGDFASFGGTLNKSPNATIGGDIISDFSDGAEFNLPMDLDQVFDLGNIFSGSMNNLDQSSNLPELPRVNYGLRWFGKLVLRIAEALGMAVIAVVAALFLAGPMKRVGQTLVRQTASAGGIGLLTIIVFPALMIILLITIILIPVSILGILAFGLLILFGWLSIGLEIGNRIAELIKTEFSPAVAAGIGTLALAFVSSIFSIVPCIGWMVPFVIASLGLGAVILSKFGTLVYTGSSTAASGKSPSSAPVSPVKPALAAQPLEPLDLDAIDLKEDAAPERDEIPPENE
ncbi:MAG: hypothetical protein JW750_04595 [Anaerolineaceae bacterium]|nr:hypothetical protein [Anaerolineaceae bacterium]